MNRRAEFVAMQTKRKMSAKERDEMMMKRMKERMGQEGDEGEQGRFKHTCGFYVSH